MVVSVNPIPSKEQFLSLLDNTLSTLSIESKKNEKKYLELLGSKLEGVVVDVMRQNAFGTDFEGSIELISGQKFPDIIAKKYYGIEVKTSKQNHWTTTGNSVLESTRVEGIERIYMLFGKMVQPIEFKYKPYEACLSDIVVTHSPRYLINMDLKVGETIFDKIKIPYDTLRNESNPIKSITDYYRKQLKPGEAVWWLDQEDTKPQSPIIRLWNNLPLNERRVLTISSMVLFPEVFSNHSDKYYRFSVWLVNDFGIVCPNSRDAFSAGGQGTLEYNNKKYNNIPKIITKLSDSLADIKEVIQSSRIQDLEHNWKIKITTPIEQWIELIVENTSHFKLEINLKQYLRDKLLT
jgi:hypothetical protein